MPRRAGHPGCWLGLAAAALCLALPAQGQLIPKDDPEALKGVTLVPQLGGQAPLKTPIVDWKGKTVELGTYFNQGKPVVLALVYYNCPLICPLVLQRLQDRVNGVPYTLGKDFNVVVISFDPSNTTEMARENREGYLAGYSKPRTPEVDAGWAFHTATGSNARVIADAVGFKYKFDESTGQYAHPALLTVLTPDGRVSGYVSGLETGAAELRVALLQASEGKIAKTWGDFFLHRCYRYDPKTGRYSLQATRIMQLTGLVTVAGLGALIAALKAGERLRRAARERAAHAEPAAALSGVGGATS